MPTMLLAQPPPVLSSEGPSVLLVLLVNVIQTDLLQLFNTP